MVRRYLTFCRGFSCLGCRRSFAAVDLCLCLGLGISFAVVSFDCLRPLVAAPLPTPSSHHFPQQANFVQGCLCRGLLLPRLLPLFGRELMISLPIYRKTVCTGSGEEA